VIWKHHADHQTKIDQTFLRNLKKKCAASDAEFEKRMKDRAEEIAAVQDTIAILNSDDSFEAFGKSVDSFLQRSSRENRAVQSRKVRAANVLRSVRGASEQITALAVAVELDGFEKAKAAIDKMVADLTRQQSEEVEHRDWCKEEMQDNTQETEAKYDHKTNMETSISDLTKTIKTLTDKITANEKAIAEMQAQMKKASEVREGENADFQETATDQRITQTILQKAVDRMSKVYGCGGGGCNEHAFLEQPGAPHIQTSGTHTDPGNGPAKFAKGGKNTGGGKVLAMLDEVMSDSKKLENEIDWKPAINAWKEGNIMTYTLQTTP